MSPVVKKAISIGLAVLLLANVSFWIGLSSDKPNNELNIQAQPTVSLGFFAKSSENITALFALKFHAECQLIPQKALFSHTSTKNWTTKKLFSESHLSSHLAFRVLRI